jgi:hypothetical protein
MCRLCAFDRNDDDMTRCRQCGAEMAPLEEEEQDEGQDSAWFHYLSIPGIGTLELVPGRALRMGKDPRSELVIPKCSQDQLATIFWTDDYDEATVTPGGNGGAGSPPGGSMGAAEGVKVDGVRITGTRTLKGGEEILAGPLRLTYLRRAKPIKGAIDAGRLGAKKPTPGQQIAAPAPGRAGGASSMQARDPAKKTGRGVVAANPAGVCVALEKTRASGTLRVTSPRGRGFVIVVQGAPRHAAFGGLSGPAALLAILALPQGRCQMVPGSSPRGAGPRIEGTFSSVIAARRAKVDAARSARPPVRPAGSRPGPAPAPARPAAKPPARPAAAPPRPAPGQAPPKRPPPSPRGRS